MQAELAALPKNKEERIERIMTQMAQASDIWKSSNTDDQDDLMGYIGAMKHIEAHRYELQKAATAAQPAQAPPAIAAAGGQTAPQASVDSGT
jgi:hypothetical protein